LTCCKSATWGKRLYFPSEGRQAEDFFARKNLTALVGSEPAILDHRAFRPAANLGKNWGTEAELQKTSLNKVQCTAYDQRKNELITNTARRLQQEKIAKLLNN
jgi:hypothetical protein